MRSKLAILTIAAAIASGGLGGYTASHAVAAAASFKDISGHWAQETVEWGAASGIIKGFPGGMFQPDGKVTESQFIAMLFRAFEDQSFVESPDSWYSVYYKQASDWNWPVQETDADRYLTRGETARITAASQGRQLDVEQAVNYLLERGLVSGRLTAGGQMDYAADAALTRAEAVQFIRNIEAAGATIQAADKPPVFDKEVSEAPVSFKGITIGDSLDRLISIMGQPARKDASEYGFQWYVYNQDYKDFAMFGVSGSKVVALYANGESLKLQGLDRDAAAADVQNVYGKPLSGVLKGNTNYLINETKEYVTMETDSSYLTVFYDLHDGGISAVQAIEKQTELSLKSFYGEPSDALRKSFELQSFDLANSARVKRGLDALQWDDGASGTARGHSADMAENRFFSHTNLDGESPGDRLTGDQIRWSAYAENIAYGQSSAIFAHEGWVNSDGHRQNILRDIERLGVGVAFDENDVPFYTQNFLTR